jgi:hypothetical protein
MAQRDLLLERLHVAAHRLRMQRSLREAGWFACALLGLLVLYESLRVSIASPPVMAGLLPLFAMLALVVLGVGALRLVRTTTLGQAAGAIDVRADLKDELKSAYWFVEQRRFDPGVERLLNRAADTAQRVDAGALFPFRLPTSWIGASALAILCGALGLMPPHSAVPSSVAGKDAGTPVLAAERRAAGTDPESAHGNSAPDAQLAGGFPRSDTDWTRAAELAHALESSEEANALEQAVRARDAKRARAVLGAMQRKQASAEAGAAARPEGEQMSAELAAGILQRLQTLLDSGSDAPARGEHDERTQPERNASLTEDQPAPATQRNTDTRHSAGETAVNSLLRSISRSSVGGEAVAGEGQMGRETGRSNVTGGAMGRRVGVSRAGAGDGTPAHGDPSGNAEAEPVLGKKTVRLESQLQRVRVEGTQAGDDPDAGALESFYAATQAQVAQLDYSAAAVHAQRSAEGAGTGADIPYAYRGPVKEYFLRQHRREK